LPAAAAPHRNVELNGHDLEPAATRAAGLALGGRLRRPGTSAIGALTACAARRIEETLAG